MTLERLRSCRRASGNGSVVYGAMAYREEPLHAPLARVDGAELQLSGGGRLPRICTGCGGTRKLREEQHAVEWRPAGGALLVGFGAIGRMLSEGLRRTATITYSTCRECRQRERNARDLTRGAGLGLLVLGIVAATVGFNGYPIAGVAIVVLSLGAFALVMRKLARQASVTVAYIHSDGTVSLRGVHAQCARAALENLRDASGAERRPNDDDDDDGR